MPPFVPKELRETADASRGRFRPRQVLRLTLMALAVGVALYVALGLVADAVAEHVSDETEVRLFGGLGEALEDADAPPPELSALFDALCRSPLVRRRLDYRLIVLDEAEPNAFALPGGAVGVTSGLLEHVHSAPGLAFVLAHELGHHEHRHALRRLGRTLLLAVGLGLVEGSAGGPSPVVELSEGLLSARYSRAEEAQADDFAVRLLEHGGPAAPPAERPPGPEPAAPWAGGRPEELLELFRWVLCDAPTDLRGPLGESRVSELFASHPLTLDRVNHVRAALGLPAVDLPALCGRRP